MRSVKGKKVLVTGGAGFIGSHLVDKLVKLGAKTTVTIFNQESLDNLKDNLRKIKLLKVDLRQPPDCLKAVKGQELVFNLAAVVGGIEFNRIHPGTLFRDNSLIGINMLEAARLKKVNRFLTVSSACVYQRHCSIPTKETEGFVDEPEPSNYGYGWGKRVSELAAKTYHQEFNMNIAVVRPYNAYGPRDHFDDVNAHVIPSLITRVFKQEDPLIVWGNGTPTRAFIYVKDVVEGMIKAILKINNADPINLGTREEISIANLVKKILKLSAKDLTIKFDTSKPNGQPRRNCHTLKAEQLINFKAKTKLDTGLKETILWYQKNLLGK